MALFDDGIDNFLQRLAEAKDPAFMNPQAPTPGMPMAPQQQQPTAMQPEPGYDQNVLQAAYKKAGVGRQRKSVLDILGGIADAFSTEGGGDANYQNRRDAELQRARAYEEDMMGREKFGFEREKFGFDKRAANTEILMKVGVGLQSLLERAGPDGVRAAIPRLVQAGVFTPEQGELIMQDPVGSAALFGELGKEGGPEYYGTPVVFVDEQGKEHVFQLGKDGRPIEVTPGAGLKFSPKLSFQDQGTQTQGVSPYTAAPTGPAIPVLGDVKQGITLGRDAVGNPVAAPIEGGALDLEARQKASELEALDNAIASAGTEIFPAIRSSIDEMAKAGSLSGVPADAVDAEGAPISGGSNLGAIIQQNVPLVEQLANTQGFSARQNLQSTGRAAIQTLEPLLKQAQSATGGNLTSRMMDTPKELEGLLMQVVNEKDYGAALKAYDRFLNRYNAVRTDLQRQLAAARSKTAAGRRETPKPAASNKPSVSNW